MKKFYLVVSLILFSGLNAWSQKIRYESSLEKAQKISAETQKMLCILISIQPPAHVQGFLSGLEDARVAAKFNEHFINYKADRTDPEAKELIEKYDLKGFPVFVFRDSRGGLLSRHIGNWPPPMLLNMLDEAIDRSKEKSLTDLDRDYSIGKNDREFLKDYINRRISAGITDNAEIIEKYVLTLPVSELGDYNEALFILKAGPLAFERAYLLVNANRKIIDSIYSKEPLHVRQTLNNTIIDNTMKAAVASKNRLLAQAAANFSQQVWIPDYREGAKNSERLMMQFFRETKDTTSFIRAAIPFYNGHYMRISADSVRSMDTRGAEQARAYAREQALLNRPPGAQLRSASYTFAVNVFSTELNSGAWGIYETGTKNPQTLSQAMLWSRRSIELNPVAAYFDTLAHLLYRMGFYAEAESTQQQAVELGRTEKRDIKTLEKQLELMKTRSL